MKTNRIIYFLSTGSSSGVVKAKLKSILNRRKELNQFIYEFPIDSVPEMKRKFGVVNGPAALLVEGDVLIDKRVGHQELSLSAWEDLINQLEA